MTNSPDQSSAATGYDEAQGYAASLRQQADWIEESREGRVSIHQRIDLGDIDVDEMRAAADFIERMPAVAQSTVDQQLEEAGKGAIAIRNELDRVRADRDYQADLAERWKAQFDSAAAAASEYSEFWEQHHGDFDQFGNYVPYSQMDGDLRAAKQRIAELEAASHDRSSAATGDVDQLALDIVNQIWATPEDWHPTRRKAHAQVLIIDALRRMTGEPQAARTRSAIMHVLGKFHRNSSYPEASDVELGIYADEILALSRPAPQAAPVTDEIKKLRAAVEYWRLAAERRDARRDLTGLDIPEAQTLDAPEPQTAANPTYPTDPADKKLAADWYTWGFQAGMEAERLGAARDAASSPLSRPQCPSESAPGASTPAQRLRE